MTEPITKEERARIINGKMPSRFCFPGAAGIVHAWVLSQAYEARVQELEADIALVMDQAEIDYAAAHKVICELQKIDPATSTWPEWATIANSIRWFATLREKHGIRARRTLGETT